jgi:2-polyprenyl-6-methoxyphenol hydroxylase-like FAD-dependent oxidoreductase
VKVSIAGAGIGGLTLGHGLARAGNEVRIIEAAARGDRLGTGITLLGNALRALDRIGLATPVLAAGYGWDVVSTRDADGNVLHQQTVPRTYKPDAPAAVGIMRTRLGDLMERHAIESGAEIDFRTTVERIEQGEDGVTVRLSSGDSDQCDVLVAADGAYSRTRLQHFGEGLRPRYCGMGGWRYTIPRPDNLNGLVLYRSPDGHIVGGLPLSKDECYLFYLENTAEHMRMPPDRLGEMLRERLAPFGAPEIQEAIELIDDRRHISFRPFDIILVPSPWHRGRIVLLGDAAHSLTPQLTSGGGMAIEDAVVLCDELAAKGSVAEALEAYSARRSTRVGRIYETSLAICRLEQDPSVGGEEPMRLMAEGHAVLAQPF